MSKKGKVVIVEDDSSILKMYQTSLQNDGYDVAGAKNGEDGVELVKKEKPDIVLLDIMMPKMDGFAVLEQLKSEESTKNIPVIMLTNLSQDEDKERSNKLGAVDYLVKSDFTPMQVSEKIKKYLR